MAEYCLKDLTTEHPGGWEDIIAFVNEHFDRYQAGYKEVDARVQRVARGYTQSAEKLGADLVYSSLEITKTLPRLEQISHPVSGICATMGWAVLKTLGLPIPGHKDWKKPSSQWRVDEKS